MPTDTTASQNKPATTTLTPGSDMGLVISVLLDTVARASNVIASQHRIKRDEATLRRIAIEIRITASRCRAALQQEDTVP